MGQQSCFSYFMQSVLATWLGILAELHSFMFDDVVQLSWSFQALILVSIQTFDWLVFLSSNIPVFKLWHIGKIAYISKDRRKAFNQLTPQVAFFILLNGLILISKMIRISSVSTVLKCAEYFKILISRLNHILGCKMSAPFFEKWLFIICWFRKLH